MLTLCVFSQDSVLWTIPPYKIISRLPHHFSGSSVLKITIVIIMVTNISEAPTVSYVFAKHFMLASLGTAPYNIRVSFLCVRTSELRKRTISGLGDTEQRHHTQVRLLGLRTSARG